MNMLQARIKRMFRETYSRLGASKPRISASSCPRGGASWCACRKPRPGMLHQAQREFHLDLSRTVFFGDDERDGQAADAAGCPWVQISQRHTLLDGVSQLLANHSSVELSLP